MLAVLAGEMDDAAVDMEQGCLRLVVVARQHQLVAGDSIRSLLHFAGLLVVINEDVAFLEFERSPLAGWIRRCIVVRGHAPDADDLMRRVVGSGPGKLADARA